jgi:LEA14-like dessication related protein
VCATRRSLLGAAAVLASGAGCTNVQELAPKAPTLAFRDLEVRDIARDRVRLGIQVQAGNPNPLAIPIAALIFAVEIAGVEIATGTAPEAPFELPARGTRDLMLEVEARSARILEALRRLPSSAGAGVAWRVHGTARWGALGIPIGFEKSGRIEPGRLLRRPQATGAGTAGATP